MASCGCPSFVDTPVLESFCPSSFALFMGAVQLVLQSTCDIADPCGRAGVDASSFLQDSTTYDFIVVGAGAAGPVVSSRLSENPNWQILQLEAGPEEPTVPQIPAFAVSGKKSPIDWQFTTVPQENACLSTEGVCSWPRGKMVGGTAAFNGMKYMRAHPSIYDSWASAGNPGWSFNDLLPYFIKAENNFNPDSVDEGYHGFGGPFVVQHFPNRPMFTESLLEAAEEIGYRRGDLAGRNQTGIGVMQGFTYNGLRGATSRMYLRAATGNRDNLKTAINTHVTKVLIHPENLTAYGVEYINSAGDTRTVLARKEIILSAGAVGSPHILLLSGVGPKENLQAVGVPILLDLPGVGKNLQNHVSTAVRFTIQEQSKQLLTNTSIEEFLSNRTGVIASGGLTTTGMFLSRHATDGVPDIQVFFVGYSAGCSRTGSDDECTNGEVSVDCGSRIITALTTNVMPQSKGFLELQSADPRQQPLIQPYYLNTTRDIEVVLDGIRTVTRMVDTSALQAWGARVISSSTTACNQLEFGTDEFWTCTLQYETNPENHQAGTCKMGPSSDTHAVVDSELRVHGVRNLRIVDASIFPVNPNANPVATIVASAEKLADMLNEAWPEDYVPNPVPVVSD